MSEIKDGGYAFPVMWTEIKSDEEGPQITACEPGMTLLDWFAGKELAKTEGTAICDRPEVYDRLADHCYRMARAMLRARSQS
jgi:hypothetical protein